MNRMLRICWVGGGIGPLICVEEWLEVRLMYLILFSAHKNINYKTNTLLFTPQDTTATYSNYSKSGEEQEDGQTLSEGFEWLQAAPKSWFHARVENGLQRGKP